MPLDLCRERLGRQDRDRPEAAGLRDGGRHSCPANPLPCPPGRPESQLRGASASTTARVTSRASRGRRSEAGDAAVCTCRSSSPRSTRPRPAEYFTRFHERARPSRRTGSTSVVRVILTPPTLLFYRTRAIGVDNVPANGPGDPHAQPLQPDGPLLRRRLPAAKGPLHGQVKLFSNRLFNFVFFHGGVFPVRRGHRDEEAFITAHAILARGGCVLMYAEGGRSRRGDLVSPKPGVGRLRSSPASPSSRWRSTAPPACAAGGGFRFPKVTVQFGEPLSLRARRAPDHASSSEVAHEGLRPVREMYEAWRSRAGGA